MSFPSAEDWSQAVQPRMGCTKCRLHETCRTVKVASRGAEKPLVMFVGEAPGHEEDVQGRAFVGPAGQLLDQAIKEYGLTPCFITNVVRCQPPGNRPPRVDEVEACKPYLTEEIKRMRPKFVVALGNTALKALTGLAGINSFSGTVVKKVGDIQVFALYHPAFILRVPGMLPKFEMHLRELQRVVAGEAKKETIPVLDVTPREAFDLLGEANGMVAFDYETSGLFKNNGGQVRAVGFFDGRNAFVTSAERHKDLPKLMRWFLKSDIPKAAYNSAFEIRWSMDEYGAAPKNLIHDPMLLHYLVDENGSMDLESVASKYLSANRWDVSALMLEKGWTYATIPYESLITYCGLDCFHTWRLPDAILKTIPPEFQGISQLYSNILLPLAHVCAQLENFGIKIDRRWAEKADRAYLKRQTALSNAINGMKAVVEYTQEKRLKNKAFGFNPGSPLQLRDVVFGKLGLGVWTSKKTKKGRLLSTDQDVMEKLKDRHPFISNYLEWKRVTTRRNNFTIKFPDYCDSNGIIHPHFKPNGTVTGRLTASDPPAHTFPRPDEGEDKANTAKIRGMVVSRFKGGALVGNDYSQLELRLLANEAEEESMMEAFEKGQDLHGLTASRIFGKGYTKQQRSIGKTINFAIGYGIQAKALSNKFNVPFDTAENWIRQFWKGYRKLYLWIERQHAHVKKHGWVMSRFGRVRHLPDAMRTDLKLWEMAALLRQAGNFPIQSAGADINNLACVKFSRACVADKLVSRMILPVHDSILIDCPKDEIRAVSARIRGIMEGEVQTACPWMKVKLKIEQGVSRRWGN